jgi:hypothetical protein
VSTVLSRRVFNRCVRLLWSFLIASVMLAAPPARTYAADESEKPMAHRMELILKNVKVLDDREPAWEFTGEMRLDARFWRVKKQDGCPRWTSSPDCIEELAATTFNFSAGTGDTFTFNRAMSNIDSGGAIPFSNGFPLYMDDVYGWDFYMVDKDSTDVDHMGLLSGELSKANGWGPPGQYDERGWVECPDPGVFGFCGPGRPYVDTPFNPPEEKPAFYRVAYELRDIPTPDLTVRSFRYDPFRDALCLGIGNVGTKPSGEFDVVVASEPGAMSLPRTQTLRYLSLDPNESMEPCIAPQMPAGEHAISFTIDPFHKINELNEGDNTYRSKFTFVPGGQR